MASAVAAGQKIIGRVMASGSDDVARLASRGTGGLGRTLGRTAGVGAVGAGAIGMGMIGNAVNDALRAAQANTPGADPGSSMVNDINGGSTITRPQGSSVRSFSPPANDNTPRKVSFNAGGDIPLEQLKVQASAANSLISIDSTLNNMLNLQVAKAQYESRALRENSLEAPAASSLGTAARMAAANGNAAEGKGGLGGVAMIGGIMALIATGLAAMNGGGGNADPAGSSRTSTGGPPGIGQSIGDAAYAAERGAVAGSRMAARSAASAISSASPIVQTIGRTGAVGQKVATFFRAIKASPVGRFPWVSTILAGIDPILALIESGGAITPDVKRQLVGAIAQLLGGAGGVAMGAAIGGAAGSAVPGLGTIVGVIAGGVLGAAAALGSEFVAEKLFDLITGRINGQQFVGIMTRGAVDGARRLPAMAIGAGLGAIGAAVGTARGLAGGARAAAPAAIAAPAAAGAASGGLRLAAPTVRSVAAVGGVAVGIAALGASVPAGSRLTGYALLEQARAIVNQYAGRAINETEWAALIKAVHGESGAGASGREDAMIAASIINRAKNPGAFGAGGNATSRNYMRQGLTILAVLYAPNQFQAVTGTRANRHRPSANFLNGPSAARLDQILRAIVTFLLRIGSNQTNFTAASTAAYGAGTNINYRAQMLAAGGSVIGGTLFNGSVGDSPVMTAPTPAASAPGMSRAPSGASGGTVGGYIVPTAGTVSSERGNRSHNGQTRMHQGQDIAAAAGTPVKAAAGGSVIFANYGRPGSGYNGLGNTVAVRQTDGNVSVYGHLSSIAVRRGQAVTQGDNLGGVGNTGASRGNHLHYEVRRNGRLRDTIDPRSLYGAARPASAATVASGASGDSHAHGAEGSSAEQPSGSIFARLASAFANFGKASDPYHRAEEINNASASAAKAPVVVVQAPSQTRSSGSSKAKNDNTNSVATESVSSPVMSAYAYMAYWGVGN